MAVTSGYLHPGYAASLAEFGTPRELRHCRGWILERPVPSAPGRDAMGCYPLFACEDWSRLPLDLEELRDDLVSLVLVTDPFGDCSEASLRRTFDQVLPFKDHFVADLRRPLDERASNDRRRCARTAHRRGVRVEECPDPLACLDDWIDLFRGTTEALGVRGIRAFSREAFRRQLALPGMVVLRAVWRERTVAMGLFAIHGETAYAHVAAHSDASRDLRASCGLYHASMEILSDRVRWIDWGGNAGDRNRADDGLARFKLGWSTGRRTAYLCGRIFDRERYEAFSRARGVAPATSYFPAYRAGEFGGP